MGRLVAALGGAVVLTGASLLLPPSASAAPPPTITATFGPYVVDSDGVRMPTVVFRGTGFTSKADSDVILAVSDLSRDAPGFGGWYVFVGVNEPPCKSTGAGPQYVVKCVTYQPGELPPHRLALSYRHGLAPHCGDVLVARAFDVEERVHSNDVQLKVTCDWMPLLPPPRVVPDR